MKQSESILAIAPAFIQAQAKIEGAIKNSENGHLHNRYADLSAVIDACRAHLATHDLAVLQTTDCADDQSYVVIETTLIHKSGEWFQSSLKMPLEKRNAHGVGSAITYGRRYALAAMVGIAQVDDDAEGSINRSQQQQYQQHRQSGRQQAQKQEEAQQPPSITKEQAETIQGLLDEAGVSAQTFCKKYGLSHLGAMPANWFAKAVTKLENDIEKMNATTTEEA